MKIFKFKKLQTRIIVLFAAIIFMVQLAGLLITNTILSRSTNDEIRQRLAAGDYLFNYTKREDERRLIQTASILSSDFAFREAVATTDRATVVSALANHGERAGADVMFLVATDNSLIADSVGTAKHTDRFPFPDLIATAEQEGSTTAIVVYQNKLYHLVVVPVLAPTPIAWLASGFVIDNNYTRHLQSMTELDVSYLSHDRTTGKWTPLASTLGSKFAVLPEVLSGVFSGGQIRDAHLQLGDEKFLARILVVAESGNTRIVAVLQRSLHSALEPLRRLQVVLLWLSSASFLVALLASTWMARSITTPIRTLSAQARRIERGDYTQLISLVQQDELGQLASTFNHMTAGIAVRETKIMELANQDPLTGLPNRTLFHDRLEQAIKATKRSDHQVAVLIIDLDRFKEVNDIMGHQVGDQLLREVASRLQQAIKRDYDTVARLGGDEFAVLLSSADFDGAQIVAANLLHIIDRPLTLEGQEIVVNASIGIACCPEHAEDISTLIRYADLAMYAAKQSNAGYVTFDPSLDWQKHEHLSLMADLRRAIEQKELVLYYQPKMGVVSGRVEHVEALVRWVHPERGMVPPDAFIPFAEHTGFIRLITKWVIEQAFRQLQAWQQGGLSLTVSINISARDLFIADLPEFFAGLMATYKIPPERLVLEITESAIMFDPQSALAILNQLHDMGLVLSVDDFGTGYSSLAYLKKLPVSELKIDKSFVSGMESEPDDVIIVRSTIDLAHNMGLKVVAEGVENLSTWRMLEAMGCDLIQGYYISRPIAAETLPAWLESFRPDFMKAACDAA